MGKTRIVKYYFTLTALILVALLLAAGLIMRFPLNLLSGLLKMK